MGHGGDLGGIEGVETSTWGKFSPFPFRAEGMEWLRGVTSYGAILVKVSLTPVRHEADVTRPGEAERHAQSRERWGGMLLGTANEAG
jgi:hypothetical protein